ncbi:hypothetical protein GGI21_001971 [Coemansia aciculifera]|nr:hypothetical protein GGI21_001971 [Coemansia aciculifera]
MSSIASIKECPWVLCNSYNEHSTSRLATTLNIYAELDWVYSGKALEILSQAPYNDCVFLAARAILFDFSFSGHQTDEDESDKDESVVQANMTAFVRRLQQLAPRAREYHLSNGLCHQLYYVNESRFSCLLGLILADMDHYVYKLGKDWLDLDLNYDGVCNLTRIDYALDNDKDAFLTLVRQCAPVLQSLKLQCQNDSMAETIHHSELIQDSDDSFVTYPCLQNLYLSSWADEDSESDTILRPTFGTNVPFPTLRHIYITNYEFGDDTLFRGNAAMLESLQMTLDTGTVTMLRERRVFTHNSHPHLRSVAIGGSLNLASCEFATSADFFQFILSIGPDAVARALYCRLSEEDIPRSIQLLREHSSIRTLSFRHTCFMYLDVIALIKALPLLSDLCLDEVYRDTQLIGITMSQLFDMLIETHAPMGKQLRRFIARDPHCYVEGLVEFVVLLTSLCPNLYFIEASHRDFGPIGRYMRECVDLLPLQKYEQVVQRMLHSADLEHPATGLSEEKDSD